LTTFFVDTSALAKRYMSEVGSSWVRGWILPSKGHTVIISRLATVEMVSLMIRKHREGVVTYTDFARNRDTFFKHARQQYEVIELEQKVLSLARRLLVRHPLRTLDAVQLASALSASQAFGTLTFISADTRLLEAAAEGLPTDDPNAHP
jgi:predicted nucleic acid-binding protein